MFDKLMQARQKAEEIKEKLNTIHVKGEAGNNKVCVVLNANKGLVDIQIDDALLNIDRKEELIDMLSIAFEKALEAADAAASNETMAMMSSMMPGLGNIFGK